MGAYKDYIPFLREEFNEWQENFVSQAKKRAEEWALPEEELKKLVTLQKDYDDLYAVANKQHRTTRNSVQVLQLKNSIIAYQTELRSFVQGFIRYNKLIPDSGKLALGVTIPDTIRTRRGTPATIPAVATIPIKGSNIMVYISQAPEADGTSRRAKPKDVARIEVAAFVGKDAPANANDISMKSQYTRSPVRLSFSRSLSGQTAFIYCRFIGFNNMPGDWSKPHREVITL